MNLYSGAALAELGIISTHWNHHNLDRLHIRIASYALILVGLFLCSCPVRDPEWTTWSRALYHTGWHIFPKVVTHQTDYWGSVGTLFLLLGLICAPSAQRQLSCRPMLWLGSISLPVYLFHGPLMRSVLIWALLGWKKAEGDVSQGAQKPQIPQTWLICVCIPIYFVILFATSQAWNLYVEPWCAWLTNKLVEYMFGNGAEYAKRKAAEGDEAKEGLLMGQV